MGKANKIEVPNGEYYCKIWLVIFDGGSDQWLYVTKVGPGGFLFIELIDLPAYCGRDAQDRWAAEVALVDVITTPIKTIISAIHSAGGDLEDLDFRNEEHRLRLAEMMFGHGAKAPLWSECGGPYKEGDHYDDNCVHFRRLRKEAREFAETLFDEEELNHILDTKIVNKMGQTAREFSRGIEGHWDALRRIMNDPNATEEQQLLLKMYQNAGQTLGAGPVPTDIMEGRDDG